MDAPIDTRLNPRVGQSAADFLETASRDSLVRAVREYGEERRWSKVVNAIISARGTGRLQTTLSAAELVATAVGGVRAKQRIHPATKTPRYKDCNKRRIRGVGNDFTESLSFSQAGGVLAVISFHSLEDRIVKRFMRKCQVVRNIGVIRVLLVRELLMQRCCRRRQFFQRGRGFSKSEKSFC